ncbi:soluble calcium-activated nucleotidase 1-like [Lepeophtheirus salmonis]|uniref:soluble calcium-activated nucleotidase 1-like n=1 Tax=Lepeophtheirus salmonis TaxID=72036 RepID=UPI001AE7F79E|nr:soluble calcium-activated nucleotidase 1-like [Lepeophtheirus salmonis]
MDTTFIVLRSPGILFYGVVCLFVLPRSTEGAPFYYTTQSKSYRIGMIADLDAKAKKGNDTWYSFFKRGYLTNEGENKYSVKFDDEVLEVRSKLSYKLKGMELSDLIVFNDELYSCDDKTGVISRLNITSTNVQPIPWVILSDGNGNEVKGFKCEWMTVKDDCLFVGGHGLKINQSKKTMYIKKISKEGEVEHISWVDQFEAIRKVIGITDPGYITHEAVNWSPINNKWFFLPRKASTEEFDEEKDEIKGTNFLIKMNGDDIEVIRVGNTEEIESPSHGYSSFKFIPGSEEKHILALKSEEHNGNTASYISVFDIMGKILMPEIQIADDKFEGIEFI